MHLQCGKLQLLPVKKKKKRLLANYKQRNQWLTVYFFFFQDIEILKEFGLGSLLQIAAELLNDRLPEARESARSITSAIHSGFSKENDAKEEGDGEKNTLESWQSFCSSNLPPISAQSIAKLVLL